MLSWKVIEGQEGIGVFGQAVNGLWVLGSVLGLERGDSPLGMIPGRRLPNLMDTLLNLWTQRFGHVVQDVGRLVEPAALVLGLGVDL